MLADETRVAMSKFSGDRIFVIDIRERQMGDDFGEHDSVLADLGNWRFKSVGILTISFKR